MKLDITKFINYLNLYKLNTYGISIIKNNEKIYEQYFYPYDENKLHRMFSVTKSFTGLAILLLINDYKLKLADDITKFVNYPKKDILIPKTTIKDLLTMKTPHYMTTYKFINNDNYLESFFKSKPSNLPNAIFQYDTSSSYVLSYIVEKITKMDLLDYLKLRLKELELSKESYIIKSKENISLGGSGLIAKLTDIEKVGLLYLNKGVYNNKQLIDSKLIKQAISIQSFTDYKEEIELRNGYGYQIWKVRNDGFMFFGLGDQLVIGYPKEKLLITIISDNQHLKGSINTIFNGIYTYLIKLKENNIKQIKYNNNFIKEYNFNSDMNLLKIDKIKIDLKNNNLLIKKSSIDYLFNFIPNSNLITTFPNSKYKINLITKIIDSNNIFFDIYFIDEIIGSLKFFINYNDKNLTIKVINHLESNYSDWKLIASGYASN